MGKAVKHGSLFSGIGGFDLGFERAGIETIWEVEIEDYCRRVLARHFPSATRYNDIRTVGKHNLAPVDIISGGFPCQDISNAGKRAGIEGERSGLWSEMHRVICELRPRYVVVENVAALLGRGMGRVLGDLASCGYDAEWQSIRASDVGAPHRRERIWIVGYPVSSGLTSQGLEPQRPILGKGTEASTSPSLQQNVAHPASVGRCEMEQSIRGRKDFQGSNGSIADSSLPTRWSWWAVEPDVGRVAHGIPARVDRLRGLGNAIVPQIAEWIGRRIVDCEANKPEGK